MLVEVEDPFDEDDVLDDTSPLLPPDADDVLPVLDTPPVLVDDPPDDVDVDPPLLLDVDDTMMPLDPPPEPPPPPKKPPAKNPPPIPPPPVPPTTTGPPPKPPPADIAPGSYSGGNGIGADWLATVTTAGGQVAVVRVTTRRTVRWRETRCTARFVTARLVIARLVICRCGDDSATCTAPPPMIAPPHAQAQSFASAIFTDMPSQSSPSPKPWPFAAFRKTVSQQDQQTVKFNRNRCDPCPISVRSHRYQRAVRATVPERDGALAPTRPFLPTNFALFRLACGAALPPI